MCWHTVRVVGGSMNDSYIYVIVALLPLAACMLVLQANPYEALVIRGVLGAIAAMLYSVLGAADVALTEALVGTMLAITLYAVAVRSSLVMRLGVLKDELVDEEGDRTFGQLMDDLRAIFGKRYMRLEVIPYADAEELQQALVEKEVHATCCRQWPAEKPLYFTATRLQRLYNIMASELSSPAITVSYVSALDSAEKSL